MKICTDHKLIESKCKDIEDISQGIKIGKRMIINTCLTGKNRSVIIGLAHNQVFGNYNIFVAKLDNKWKIFVNPKIMSTKNLTTYIESCMSFPGKENKVNRFQDIVLQHYTENGMIVEKFSGQNAQIIQHEIDHLNGIHIFNKGDK